jgi:hypothetical protein
MAAYTEAKSKHWTLTASTVDSLTITGQHTAVEIAHHNTSASPVYFLVSKAATTPAVAADDTEVVLPGERIKVSVGNAGTVVSVISAGTPTISVIGVL